jgi:hypothetical protein
MVTVIHSSQFPPMSRYIFMFDFRPYFHFCYGKFPTCFSVFTIIQYVIGTMVQQKNCLVFTEVHLNFEVIRQEKKRVCLFYICLFSSGSVGRGLTFTKNAPIKSDNESFYIAPVVDDEGSGIVALQQRPPQVKTLFRCSVVF